MAKIVLFIDKKKEYSRQNYEL